MATKQKKISKGRKDGRKTLGLLASDLQLIRQYQERRGITGVSDSETVRLMMRKAAEMEGLEVA